MDDLTTIPRSTGELTQRQAPGKIDGALEALEPALETALEGLGAILPWWAKVPAKIGLGLIKKRIAHNRFKRLLVLILDFALYSEIEQDELRDLRFVGSLAQSAGSTVSLVEAEKLIDHARIMLRTPYAERLFAARGEGPNLALALRKLSSARPGTGSEVQLARNLAQSFDTAIGYLGETPRTDHHYVLVLGLVERRFRELLDDFNQNIDVNYMVPVTPSSQDWTNCSQCAEAIRVFEHASLATAKTVLRVKWSTTDQYMGFWVPVFDGQRLGLTGASDAFSNRAPRVVYCREPQELGNGHSGDMKDRICDYLKGAPFPMFISLPVITGTAVCGVVNLNLYTVEHKFRSNTELARAYLSVKPLLAVLGRLSDHHFTSNRFETTRLER